VFCLFTARTKKIFNLVCLLYVNTAKKSIAAGALKIHGKNEISLQQLDAAMDDLVLLKYPLKKRVLQACASCISHNGKVMVKGLL